MKLTDSNIDTNSARYWCFLSDKTLKEAFKEIIKDTNSRKSKQLNEFVVPLAVVGAGKALLWIAASLGADWALQKIASDDPEAASEIQQDPRKAFEIFTTNTKSMIRADDLQATANQIENDKFLKLCDVFQKIDLQLYGGEKTPLSQEEITSIMNDLQGYDANVIGLAYLLNKELGGSFEDYLKNPAKSPEPGSGESLYSRFIVSQVDDFKKKFDPKERLIKMKEDIASGAKQLKFDNGKVTLVDVEPEENQPEASAAKQKPDSKEEKDSGKPEENKDEKKAEEAAEQSVKDSPEIQSNSNAMLWIAGAAAAAVALPYLWKRLKQLADYIKSGKTFAKCQFRCSENGQEYSFEYDLKQKEWKLKFAGSTALKYTPYPSDDEVNSFVKTKFAKEFVDEIEQQLRSLYSAKDKKLVFKAVQAAGKEGSDLIKYLFDNQKAIESSMYKISKYKLWESILKKYKMWESARLQERARH